MSTDKPTVWRHLFTHERFMWFGIGLLLFGLMFLGISLSRGIGLRVPKFAELTVVSGTFTNTPKAIGIKTWHYGIPRELLCSNLVCGGFKRVGLVGKPARVWVTPSDDIFQIEVDGAVLSDYESILANDKFDRLKALVLMLLGACVVFFSRRRK